MKIFNINFLQMISCNTPSGLLCFKIIHVVFVLKQTRNEERWLSFVEFLGGANIFIEIYEVFSKYANDASFTITEKFARLKKKYQRDANETLTVESTVSYHRLGYYVGGG